MELETNTPISDDVRLLAQAKKLTLEPVHAGIVPEEMPDSVVVANHLRAAAPANVSTDIEQDAPLITPVVTADHADAKHSPKMYVLTGTGIVALAVVILLVILSS